MANWYGASRTNYFKVTNEIKYREIFNGLICSEDEIEDFTKTAEDGSILHGFGGYGYIYWQPPVDKNGNLQYSEDYDADYELQTFLEELSEILTDDSIFILETIGNEKLRYLTADIIIVEPKKAPEFHSLQDLEDKILNNFYGKDKVPSYGRAQY